MRTICFLPLHASSWKEMRPLARDLGSLGRTRPLILATEALAPSLRDDCRELGLEVVLLAEKPTLPGLETLAHLARRVREKTSLVLGLDNGALGAQIRHLRQGLVRQYQSIVGLFDQLQPAAVAILDARKYGWQMPIMRVCRQRGIPTFVPPVALTARRLELAQRRRDERYFADLYPKIRDCYPWQCAWDPARRANIFFYPVEATAALGSMEMLPPDPWVQGGGFDTTVMVEGQEMRDYYAASGLDPARMVVTGHRAHDSLHHALARRKELRRELGARYGLAPGRLILLTPPSFAEQGLWGWDRHWQEIRFLCQIVAQAGAPALVSLHPKMKPSNYDFIQREYGLPLVKECIEEVLPVADIFMASYSSTVPWAVLCQAPTLVFGFQGLQYDIFDHLGGVTVVKKREYLAPALEALLQDEDYFQAMAKAQVASADRLSPFDGHCTDRILALLDPTAG